MFDYFLPFEKKINSNYKQVQNDQLIIENIEKPDILIQNDEMFDDNIEEGGDRAMEGDENQQNKNLNDHQSGDPFIYLPESYQYQTFNYNPFKDNELLFKTVIKRDQLYFFVQIFYSFEKSLEQMIFFEQALNYSYFTLKVDSMLYKSGWDSEISLTFEQLIDNLIKPYTEFSFFKFLYTKGFTPKQKIAIKKGLEKYLQVKDCQFILNWNAQDQYVAQTPQNMSNDMNPIIQLMHNDYIMDQDENEDDQDDEIFDDASENQYQNISQKNEDENSMTEIQQSSKKLQKGGKKQKIKHLQFQNQDITQFSDGQKFKKNMAINETDNQEVGNPQKIVSFADLNFIIGSSKKIEKYHNKIKSTTPLDEQQLQFSTNINDQLAINLSIRQGDRNAKYVIPKLPTVMNETSIVEFKRNLDSKILAQNNYETPAHEEDYIKSFNLLNLNDLVVTLKYIKTEQKSFHKILIYKPMSKTPLSSCDIYDINVLERFLNLKWLDVQTITLIKKQTQLLRRKPIEPQIHQGLVSIDNLKRIIFSYFYQVKDQMNGKKINLKPIFSVEFQFLIKH